MSKDKKIYHHRHRARAREAIKTIQDIDNFYIPTRNIEVSDVWSMARDGNQYYVEQPKESDSEWYKKWYKKIKRK